MNPNEATQELVDHYRARGLEGDELLRALRRHARLVRGTEPEVTAHLIDLACFRPRSKP